MSASTGPEQLTTESVDVADRVDFWREVVCAVYVKLEVEATDAGPFAGSVSWAPWGATTISQVVSDGQVVTRHPDGGSDDCLLSIQVTGSGRISQSGRTAVLGPGDFALYDATRPYRLAFDEPFSQIVVQFPRRDLIARNVHIESSVARANGGGIGVGAVTTALVRTLNDNGPHIGDGDRTRLGAQVIDFAALALSGTAPETSVIEFNRQRILAHVDRHLHDPGLTVASVARAFAVSTRTVHKLFAADEFTLGARIRLARLERSRRALDDPGRRHLTVAAIAAESGFGGPSQLSRAFRRAYGVSPSDYRRRFTSEADGG